MGGNPIFIKYFEKYGHIENNGGQAVFDGEVQQIRRIISVYGGSQGHDWSQ